MVGVKRSRPPYLYRNTDARVTIRARGDADPNPPVLAAPARRGGTFEPPYLLTNANVPDGGYRAALRATATGAELSRHLIFYPPGSLRVQSRHPILDGATFWDVEQPSGGRTGPPEPSSNARPVAPFIDQDFDTMPLDPTRQQLSAKQRKAIEALLVTGEVKAAAATAGVHRDTLHRWLKQPVFLTAVRQAEADALDELSRLLVGLGRSAVSTSKRESSSIGMAKVSSWVLDRSGRRNIRLATAGLIPTQY